MLLEAGVSTDFKTIEGNTVFIIACDKGHIEFARMLLHTGVNI